MNGFLLLLLSLALFALGYVFYGGWLARRFKLHRDAPTPALKRRDGVDFVPARKPVLIGHHFASIAGASPIVDPVLAAVFGWLPVWLWIVVGGIMLGAVHDFSSLVASIRHRGAGIGVIIERYMGRRGRLLFLLFSWLTMLLVIAVFTILVSGTFVQVPATASSSILFILLALGFGFLPQPLPGDAGHRRWRSAAVVQQRRPVHLAALRHGQPAAGRPGTADNIRLAGAERGKQRLRPLAHVLHVPGDAEQPGAADLAQRDFREPDHGPPGRGAVPAGPGPGPRGLDLPARRLGEAR